MKNALAMVEKENEGLKLALKVTTRERDTAMAMVEGEKKRMDACLQTAANQYSSFLAQKDREVSGLL
jgi:hypothetical protein